MSIKELGDQRGSQSLPRLQSANMKFLIVAALVAVAAAAPQQQFVYNQQPFSYQPFNNYNKPAVVATVTKTVTKPGTYQVPVATFTRNDDPDAESSQPQFGGQSPQYAAKPNVSQTVVKILKLERSQEPSGDYSYFFQADNGIQASEKAVIKTVRDEKNEDHYVPNVEGSYSYTGPDGVQYTVNYVADEFGYRASGNHLPVPSQANH